MGRFLPTVLAALATVTYGCGESPSERADAGPWTEELRRYVVEAPPPGWNVLPWRHEEAAGGDDDDAAFVDSSTSVNYACLDAARSEAGCDEMLSVIGEELLVETASGERSAAHLWTIAASGDERALVLGQLGRLAKRSLGDVVIAIEPGYEAFLDVAVPDPVTATEARYQLTQIDGLRLVVDVGSAAPCFAIHGVDLDPHESHADNCAPIGAESLDDASREGRERDPRLGSFDRLAVGGGEFGAFVRRSLVFGWAPVGSEVTIELANAVDVDASTAAIGEHTFWHAIVGNDRTPLTARTEDDELDLRFGLPAVPAELSLVSAPIAVAHSEGDEARWAAYVAPASEEILVGAFDPDALCVVAHTSDNFGYGFGCIDRPGEALGVFTHGDGVARIWGVAPPDATSLLLGSWSCPIRRARFDGREFGVFSASAPDAAFRRGAVFEAIDDSGRVVGATRLGATPRREATGRRERTDGTTPYATTRPITTTRP